MSRVLGEHPGIDKGPYYFAAATVLEYEVADVNGAGLGEVLRYSGVAADEQELHRIVENLSEDCTMFLIHLELFGKIVGNGEYVPVNTIDPLTGKRQYLGFQEFGECDGFHCFFQDLYDTEEEYERYIANDC